MAENPATQVSKADMSLSEKQQLVTGWKYRVEVLPDNLTMNGVGTKGDEWLVAQGDLQNTYSACLVKDGETTCNFQP